MRLLHTMLRVNNLDESLKFYCDKLGMKLLRKHDFPGGEWRRVQRAEGYHTIMVNGQVTFSDDKCTGATPGSLLRHGG